MLGPVELVDEIDSTNAELLRRARAGAPAGLVLVARHQTAGRGRHDRRWEAPPGASLLVSVLLRPSLAPDQLHLVTHAAGLAAVDACRALAGVELGLKWPNDVVDDGPDGARKVAGLLAESVLDGDAVAAVVVGMGLNVNWATAVPAGGLALNQLAGRDIDADALLVAWVEGFGALLESLASDAGRAALLQRYRAASATMGRRVAVATTNDDLEGVAAGITDEGHLLIDTPAGTLEVAVGDVVHLRPAG